MQISLDWLKEYIKLKDNTEEITKLLTFSGIEVEDVHTYGDLPKTVITARIVECVLMDGSDHLQICQVDTGLETIQVVCGAPNCTHGMIGVLALPGTKIGDMTIKQTHIRGTESCGMLCSEMELGLSDEHSGIISLPQDTKIGFPVKDLFNLPDTLFELEITPNRSDLLGYLGIATDLAANTGNALHTPSIENVRKLVNADFLIGDYLTLENLEAELCPRYTARVFKDIRVTESPLWLRLRLLKSGLRPISNIVDITNYIMLETGHPLHAFDYDKLEGLQDKPSIIVRRAEKQEEFAALDGKTYKLDDSDLVIADGKKAIALAGVIGGTNSHITESTTNIVLEAACFNHSSIRRTSYKYKIQTDSAYRFERNLSSDTAEYASARAAQMIIELAGGILCNGMLDDWQTPATELIIPLRPHRLQKVIGISLSKEQIAKYLTKLGLVYLGEGCYKKYYPDSEDKIPKLVKDQDNALYFEVESEDGTHLREIEPIEEALYFVVPQKRVDLTREVDLIEEVIRLYGMDNVPQRVRLSSVMDRFAFKLKRQISEFLVYNGYQEVVNLSFTDPNLISKLELNEDDARLNQIALLNPQNSNLSVMRTSLLPQLLLNAEYNLNHGTKQIKLYELNKVFLENSSLPKLEPSRLSLLWLGNNNENHWKIKPQSSDFYQLKGIIEDLLEQTGLTDYGYSSLSSGYLIEAEAQSIVCNGLVIAEYGKIQPAIAAHFNIDTIELKQDLWMADIDLEKVISIVRTKEKTYQAIPRFPSVERDISFLIKSGIEYTLIQERIRMADINCISDLSLIDEYKGKQIPDGFRSLTFRIIFNHREKTLTDEEVDTLFASIVNDLKSRWEIQLR